MNQHPYPKRLLLGMTGGIAAFKCAELVRLLVQDNWDVQVVMTQAATRFITPLTMQALSGKPVYADMWDSGTRNGMGHIDLSRDRSLILIAPASADFLSKLAHGGADDLLSTLCLARQCTLMVAPAMNRQMWDNPATQRNMEQLRSDGVLVAGPAAGEQACGETGLGRMLEANELVQELARALAPKILAGKKVVLTAGPTFEPIDPVRGITNRSSGKMGYALAQAALESGAEVTIISGPVALAAAFGARVISVTTAAQMLEAAQTHASSAGIFISVAAVADYRASTTSPRKLKKGARTLALELEPTTDILATIASQRNPPFCVGFAAESEDLDRNAEDKRRRKKLPLLIGNIAQEAIGADDSAVVLYDSAGRHALPKAAKIENARRIVAHIAQLINKP
ncbi:MAG: bifunctional phosphopantothenoylcysteine decarboxylase/phosphopantothenate--cysteine ligase CoaBC [Betaproteobacteria bacterium]|nr:bifunctional phosphopantothenoylcysteine decarboxylase/phosphopantothenate--cysteine ligase CoaBC [Betaproteobacteria bacterium]